MVGLSSLIRKKHFSTLEYIIDQFSRHLHLIKNIMTRSIPILLLSYKIKKDKIVAFTVKEHK